MNPIYDLLRINEADSIAALEKYLNELIRATGQRDFILGLSGGIDSAFLTTAMVRFFGSASVQGVYLYDQDSSWDLGSNARSLAEDLGIHLSIRSIEPEMNARGIYKPLPMRITRRWAVLNRLLYRVYTILAGEPPFLTTLRVGSGEMDETDTRYRLYRMAYKATEDAFNTRHIFRRQVLEQYAENANAILVGAANRSEWKIGWFVKGGVDDVAYQPLKGLYKTQVRQLSEYLNLPRQIRTQMPSPDMRKGITDEFAIGMPYKQVDVLLDYLEGGIGRESLGKMFFFESRLTRVREMIRLSTWKRDVNLESFPVDGGPGSYLRIAAQ